jgi:hypothetical protein
VSRVYKPRRASKRWLDGDCPPEVLALYDNGGKSADRYSVLYTVTHIDARGVTWLFGRGMNSCPNHPQGIGMSFERPAHELAAWRHREKKTKWTALPKEVRAAILDDCESFRKATP